MKKILFLLSFIEISLCSSGSKVNNMAQYNIIYTL